MVNSMRDAWRGLASHTLERLAEYSGGIAFSPHAQCGMTIGDYLAKRGYDFSNFIGGVETVQRCIASNRLIEVWWYVSDDTTSGCPAP